MEEKKPFMPPPPKGLKVPSQQAVTETAKPQEETKAETKANPPVEKVAPVSAKEPQKPVAQPQPKAEVKTGEQPKQEAQKNDQQKKEKKNLLAPMAFIFWGAVAVVLIVLFIILKDKI